MVPSAFRFALATVPSSVGAVVVFTLLAAASPGQQPAPAAGQPPAAATGGDDFAAYRETIGDSGVGFDLVPIAGGRFLMGSPAGEKDRKDDEGPQVEVDVAPFWMGRHEVTWAEYDQWNTDASRPMEKKPDGVARPTPPYMDMTFNMGRDGYPAICMSHIAARQYCAWLSQKTGRFYRLPTEAEWEWAAIGGILGQHQAAGIPLPESAPLWHIPGSIGFNELGIYNMTSNVWEWCWDHDDSQTAHRIRGGMHFESGEKNASRLRISRSPDSRLGVLGFRLARNA